MERSEHLLAQVTRAYERGRIVRGLRLALLVPPLVLISLGGCGSARASIAIGAALAALVVALTYRGGSASRGVVPGLIAGIAPLVVPLFVCPWLARSGLGGPLPLLGCVAGGVLSGVAVARFAKGQGEHRFAFALAAGLVCALTGSLGCVDVGLGGIAAMAAGLAVAQPLAWAAGALSAW
jgi:hypothetical protein